MEKKALSAITREEWIGLIWEEVTAMGDGERMFRPVALRTPDEAAQASDDWDSTEADRKAAREAE